SSSSSESKEIGWEHDLYSFAQKASGYNFGKEADPRHGIYISFNKLTHDPDGNAYEALIGTTQNVLSKNMALAYFKGKNYKYGEIYRYGDEYAFKIPPSGTKPEKYIQELHNAIAKEVGKKIRIKGKGFV